MVAGRNWNKLIDFQLNNLIGNFALDKDCFR